MIIIRGEDPEGKGGPITDAEAGDTSPDAWRKVRWTFAIAATETTWEEYHRFKSDFRSKFVEFEQSGNYPVFEVSALQALAFARWLGDKEGLSNRQAIDYDSTSKSYKMSIELQGYRLPVEPEWERACRSGVSTSRFFGSRHPELAALFVQGSQSRRPQPVAIKMPNRHGVSDMLGNLYEWTLSEVTPLGERINTKHASDRIDENSRFGLLGGSFWQSVVTCRPDLRIPSLAIDWAASENFGVRLVRTIQFPTSEEIQASNR
jgi:formylglycine-generating enzyme required for sulfatase activity